MFRIYGNRGEYVMPATVAYETREDALAYARQWWPDNRFVYVLECAE